LSALNQLTCGQCGGDHNARSRECPHNKHLKDAKLQVKAARGARAAMLLKAARTHKSSPLHGDDTVVIPAVARAASEAASTLPSDTLDLDAEDESVVFVPGGHQSSAIGIFFLTLLRYDIDKPTLIPTFLFSFAIFSSFFFLFLFFLVIYSTVASEGFRVTQAPATDPASSPSHEHQHCSSQCQAPGTPRR
jgi:hypothetical protein